MDVHVWGQRELEARDRRRKKAGPSGEFSAGTPGQGYRRYEDRAGPVTVVNLLGRVFMNPSDCPFRAMDALLNTLPRNVPIIVDFHAEGNLRKDCNGLLSGRSGGRRGPVRTRMSKPVARGCFPEVRLMTDLRIIENRSHSVIGRSRLSSKFLRRYTGPFEVAGGPCVEGPSWSWTEPVVRSALQHTATGKQMARTKAPLRQGA